MIIPFPPSKIRSQIRSPARQTAASLSASERRALLEQLQHELHVAGPHGVTAELQATLKRLGCASEHEALLTVLGLLLDKHEQVPAAGRCGGEIAYSSLY